MDYRSLNSYTVPDTYPLPLISVILEQLQGKKLFTKFDIRWGYNNIRIREEDQWKAAFKTPFGLFQPRVMFFGLTNSPATFSRAMNRMFRHLIDKYPQELFVYMDDILIATGDDLSRHRQIVHDVLDLLEEESYFLKPSKCEFEKTEIEYLGIIVNGDHIKISPVKADGLKDWPRELKTLKEVRSVLGVLGYQRPFIPNFATIARPLTSLLKKDTPFSWTDDCRQALDALISIVLSDPALGQPDMSRPFQLEVDASAFATGAILSQKDSRGKSRAVGYHSKTFNDAERNYDIHDRELLAVVRGLDNWRHFLAGSAHPITILTDHKNLQYYRNPQRISRCVARYLPKLADYNFTLVHQPGTLNKADALSRRPDFHDGSTDNNDVTVLPHTLFIDAITASSLDDRVRAHQLKRPELLAKWSLAHNLSFTDSFHWKGSQLVVVDDNSLRRGVISLYHDSITAGHPGISKTLWAIAQDYWWPGMKETVTNYVKGCATCQSRKNNPTNPKPPLFPITTNPLSNPFETIALDFITKLPLSDGYNTILTITDHDCSKASIFIPCNETIDAEKTALLYATYVLPHYGLPRRIISDRDPRFTATFTRELCRLLQIEQNISTAYHPQTDGQSERANQWVEQFIRIFGNYQQNNWAQLLPLAQYAHNSWPSSTTKKTPFDLLMGHTPRIHQITRTSNVPSVEERLQHIKEARQQAQESIKRAQELITKTPTRFVPYCVGDRVWLEAKNLSTTHPSAKLAPRRYGPFLVTATISKTSFRLKLPSQWKIHNVFHASLLTPYRETKEHGPNFPEPSPELIDGEPECEVEQILGARHRRNQHQSLIRWKGFSEAHDSWEPAAHIHADQLITEFHQQNPSAVRSLTHINPSSSPTSLIIRRITMSTSIPYTLADRLSSPVLTPSPEPPVELPPSLTLQERMGEQVESPVPSHYSFAMSPSEPAASAPPLPIPPRYTPAPSPEGTDTSIIHPEEEDAWGEEIPEGFVRYDPFDANHKQYHCDIPANDGTRLRPHYIRFTFDQEGSRHYVVCRRVGGDDFGKELLAAPFMGPSPLIPDNTDLSILDSVHIDRRATEIGLLALGDKGIKADVLRYRVLSNEHRELQQRADDLHAAWNDWSRRNNDVKGRLVKAQVRTRLHPYLQGDAYYPSPRTNFQNLVADGTPIRDTLAHHEGHRIPHFAFPMPWLMDDPQPGTTRWRMDQGRNPLDSGYVSRTPARTTPAPTTPTPPSALTCNKCKLPNVTHKIRNCPLWKVCHWCKKTGHKSNSCPHPPSRCGTRDICLVPTSHTHFYTEGGCDWHWCRTNVTTSRHFRPHTIDAVTAADNSITAADFDDSAFDGYDWEA